MMAFLRRLFHLDGHPPPVIPCANPRPSEAERHLEQAHREALRVLTQAERESAAIRQRAISWESLLDVPGYGERER